MNYDWLAGILVLIIGTAMELGGNAIERANKRKRDEHNNQG